MGIHRVCAWNSHSHTTTPTTIMIPTTPHTYIYHMEYIHLISTVIVHTTHPSFQCSLPLYYHSLATMHSWYTACWPGDKHPLPCMHAQRIFMWVWANLVACDLHCYCRTPSLSEVAVFMHASTPVPLLITTHTRHTVDPPPLTPMTSHRCIRTQQMGHSENDPVYRGHIQYEY